MQIKTNVDERHYTFLEITVKQALEMCIHEIFGMPQNSYVQFSKL